MNGHQLQTVASARLVILPPELDSKLKTGNKRSVAQRLGAFADWLDQTGRNWTNPALADYRDSMADKQPSTVNAHLSTIRSRYRALLKDNAVIRQLDARAVQYCQDNGWEINPANVKASTDRIISTIENALDCERAKETAIQDRAASDFIRLTAGQANALLNAPGTATLDGLRDTALIALALATGARAAELADLQVGDHKARNESGALGLLIRHGKGDKQRITPYGELSFAVAIVDAWLKHAGISDGPIFRGFFRGNRKVRQTALTTVAIENIISSYPVSRDGQTTAVKPHDLRRTYAKLAYLSGMPLVAIQQNLGHASIQTTIAYIGDLDSKQRQPKGFLSFNLASLPK
jgi:site-specific recombinase XerD